MFAYRNKNLNSTELFHQNNIYYLILQRLMT